MSSILLHMRLIWTMNINLVYVIYVVAREAKSAPIIRCAKNEYLVTLGQNLTLECTVVLGHGSIIRNAFLSLWRKVWRLQSQFFCFVISFESYFQHGVLFNEHLSIESIWSHNQTIQVLSFYCEPDFTDFGNVDFFRKSSSRFFQNSSHFECHPEDGKVVYGEQNSTHSCEK